MCFFFKNYIYFYRLIILFTESMNIFLCIDHHLNASNSYQTEHGHEQEQERGLRHVKTCLTGNCRCVFFISFFYLLDFIYRFHEHFLHRGWAAMITSTHPGVTKMTTTRQAWYFFFLFLFNFTDYWLFYLQTTHTTTASSTIANTTQQMTSNKQPPPVQHQLSNNDDNGSAWDTASQAPSVFFFLLVCSFLIF